MDESGMIYTKCGGCGGAVAACDDQCHHCGKKHDPEETASELAGYVKAAVLEGVQDPLGVIREQLLKNFEEHYDV